MGGSDPPVAVADAPAPSSAHRSVARSSYRRAAARPALWVVALCGIAVVLALLAGPARLHGYLRGDTEKLVAGAAVTNTCVDRGELVGCGKAGRRSRVGSYGLLQYVPASVLLRLGFDQPATVRLLGVLSLAAFVGMLALLAWAAPGPSGLWRPLLLAAAISGPLLFYATSSFSEMLVATVVLAVVVAAHRRRPLVTILLVAVACTGKETLAPFVALLALLAARDGEPGWRPPRPMTAAIAGGAVFGLVLNALWNVFRFETVRNTMLLRAGYRVTEPERVASNLGALIVAPGGGLAPYWPLATLLLVGAGATATVLLAQRRWRDAVPLALAIGGLVAFSVGLAMWYAPFGWLAWGPRLMLPMVPATLLVVAQVGGRRFADLVGSVLRSLVGFVVVAVVVVVLAMPQLAAPWVSTSAVAGLTPPGGGCGRQVHYDPKREPDRYWACFDTRAWRIHWSPMRVAWSASDDGIRASRVAGGTAIVALLLLARIGAQRSSGRHARR